MSKLKCVGEVKMGDRQLTFEEWYETDRKCKPTTSGNEKSIPCSPTDLIRWEREAWEAAKAQEKREYELLESEHSELLANFCKVDMERIKLGREVKELQKKVGELEKEGFTLSANQCCAEDCGIHFEEGTSLFCKHEQENKRLKEENLKMRNCLNCAVFTKEPAHNPECDLPICESVACNKWEIKK